MSEMAGEIPGGVVTTADLYRELSAINSKLAVYDARFAVYDARTPLADTLHADHETRIRALERFRYALMGATIAVGTLSGVVSSVIVTLLQHH